MPKQIIGRTEILKQLKAIFDDKKASFLAMLGRRRVGKTFLIHQFFSAQKALYFQVTGKRDGSLAEQLQLFTQSLELAFYQELGTRLTPPRDWLEAFNLLTQHIARFQNNKKVVLFFDEVPWLASKKSGFTEALDYYWNMVWSKNAKMKLIICGSAASWMLEHVLDSTGGLHNRATHVIKLMPFKLKETDEYLKANGVSLLPRQVADIYMCIGGIPHYLNHVSKGKSAAQIIDQLCFQQSGIMRDEFKNLFRSLFDNAEVYEALLRAIASKPRGVSRAELLKLTKQSSGGTFKQRLNALEESGFIVQFLPFGAKEKGVYCKVVDEYSLFYLRWIESFAARYPKVLNDVTGYWESQLGNAQYNAWAGLAFEALCYQHTSQIRKALGLASSALPSTWQYVPRKTPDKAGAQIDLLFDRQDNAITLCEIKYYNKPVSVTKVMLNNLEQKKATFSAVTKTKKQLFLAIVSPQGLQENKYSGLISAVVTLESLFQ